MSADSKTAQNNAFEHMFFSQRIRKHESDTSVNITINAKNASLLFGFDLNRRTSLTNSSNGKTQTSA